MVVNVKPGFGHYAALAVLLATSSVLAQTPIREVTGVSGVTSRTIPNATDIFVDPQVFLVFPPGDYTTIRGGFRRSDSCTTVPVDTIYSAGLLIGYLPGRFDMVAQAVFLTSAAPILSEAVRVRVQAN